MVNGLPLSTACQHSLPASLVSRVRHNPGNHCYLHAAVYLFAYIGANQPPAGPLWGANHLERALSSLWSGQFSSHSSAGLVLSLSPAWRSLLSEWPHLDRQQDCMELLVHLLERHPLASLHCRGEARPMPGSVEAHRPLVCGAKWIDVPLPRRDHDTLQECIIGWHEQSSSHGLLNTPNYLLVCLARYAHIGKGKNRLRLPCKAMQQVSFPVFQGRGHDTLWTSYSLVAGALHLGSRPQTGHYRTFLAHPSTTSVDAPPQVPTTSSISRGETPTSATGISAPFGSPPAPPGSRRYTWWCTDDEKPAEVCHPTYSRTLSENCHILCFRLTADL